MSENQIKERIRQTCLCTRRGLSTEEQFAASNKICVQIQGVKQYQQAKAIALYSPIHGEIDLSDLLHDQNKQKIFCFPIMHDKALSFLPTLTTTPFIKNKLGILEPDVSPVLAVTLMQLDIIFLPLVAFDMHGTRIGMGGGYYDRLLAERTNPLLIGVAYEFQKQPFIQPDPWDVNLDGVITEKQIYWF
ncbi:MAG: 5-formyltetrahydrofolate cyclo-ligase [Legionellaceae bacterium]|nr:5-formyltetrahydrofolate cyclo-ligase [Legionellaceae bacterium]